MNPPTEPVEIIVRPNRTHYDGPRIAVVYNDPTEQDPPVRLILTPNEALHTARELRSAANRITHPPREHHH